MSLFRNSYIFVVKVYGRNSTKQGKEALDNHIVRIGNFHTFYCFGRNKDIFDVGYLVFSIQ